MTPACLCFRFSDPLVRLLVSLIAWGLARGRLIISFCITHNLGTYHGAFTIYSALWTEIFIWATYCSLKLNPNWVLISFYVLCSMLYTAVSCFSMRVSLFSGQHVHTFSVKKYVFHVSRRPICRLQMHS